MINKKTYKKKLEIRQKTSIKDKVVKIFRFQKMILKNHCKFFYNLVILIKKKKLELKISQNKEKFNQFINWIKKLKSF